MFEFLQDLWGFAKKQKKYWMLPIILMLITLSTLMIFAQGSSISPFIYALF